MNTQFTKLLTDIEFFIQDIRAFKTPDDEIEKKLDSFYFHLGACLTDNSIEKDLAAGKRVMGLMRNPKTGKDEEMSETGMICQNCGKHWLWGLAADGKTFFCSKCSKRTDKFAPVDEESICPECGECRPDDERVKAGMKCSYCAY